MNILFVCTSNKDRSPALENYFRENDNRHEYRSAGVNRYFTAKHGTRYLTQEDLKWAGKVVFAEDCHYAIAKVCFDYTGIPILLNLGEYREGQIGEDYLIRAHEILAHTLTK